jgi:dolichol-phosphate mannosyltransferase
MGQNMHEVEISIIMPAYKEELNLKELLPRINGVMSRLGISYEILAVDTVNKMDATSEVCEKNKSIYVNREPGDLYGDAVRTGIKYARGKYIIFMDADGSHSPEFIEELLRYKNEADVVIASRYVEGGGTDNSRTLILMSLIVNIVYSKFLNLDCHDVSNSFKLYKAELLKELKLSSGNFDIIEEILIKLKKRNKQLKIKEIPYYFKKRMYGETKRNLIVFAFSYFFTLLKFKFMD